MLSKSFNLKNIQYSLDQICQDMPLEELYSNWDDYVNNMIEPCQEYVGKTPLGESLKVFHDRSYQTWSVIIGDTPILYESDMDKCKISHYSIYKYLRKNNLLK